MSARRSALVVVGVATLVGVAGCAESTRPLPTEIGAGSPTRLLDGPGSGVGQLLVRPVDRGEPLASDVSWTFVAGSSGGYSSNPDLGFEVIIPPGALDTTVSFTVTALAGTAVAYRFEPHAEFDETVLLRQSLTGTDASVLLPLVGGHFSGDLLGLGASGLALVTELAPAIADALTNSVTLQVSHFSGWVVASGRSDDE